MKPPRYVHLFFALVFYGFLAAAGAIWIHYACPKDLTELFTVKDRWLTYGSGVGCGVAIAGISALTVRIFRSAKILEEEFGYLLGNQKVWEIFVLAGISGIAEELIFRGALQQMVGPILATAVFALAHPPFTKRLRLWPVFALAVGAVFAVQVEVTGNLVAPILTHAIVNLINLLRISAKYGALER